MGRWEGPGAAPSAHPLGPFLLLDVYPVHFMGLRTLRHEDINLVLWIANAFFSLPLTEITGFDTN